MAPPRPLMPLPSRVDDSAPPSSASTFSKEAAMILRRAATSRVFDYYDFLDFAGAFEAEWRDTQ